MRVEILHHYVIHQLKIDELWPQRIIHRLCHEIPLLKVDNELRPQKIVHGLQAKGWMQKNLVVVKKQFTLEDGTNKVVETEALNITGHRDKSADTANTEMKARQQHLLNSPISQVPPKNERDNIIIVYYIPNINSSRLLKEIFAPNISVKCAYSLTRGFIAIHLNNQQDKLKLLECLTLEAFGGGNKAYDLSARTQTLFLTDS